MNEKISAHLRETNKSYFAHMGGALKTSGQCIAASIAAFLHGVFPFIFETTASDLVRVMYKRQNSESRKDW